VLGWDLKHGKNLHWYEKLQADGHSVRALRERPQLYEDLVIDYHAFSLLNASRRIGMTAGSIPISEIHAYCRMFEINGWQQRKEFLRRIKILDGAYLNYIKSKEEDE